MLESLNIENFILLDKVCIDFSTGLNVLTGETGAGKSIIVDAIEGVTGGKVNKDQIKTGQKQAYIEATFGLTAPIRELLKENGFEELEDTITLSRTIQKSSSKCRINGELVSLDLFKLVGENLIDIIGQNDNQHLFRVENHKKIIDSLGSEDHKNLLDNIKITYLKLNLVKREFEELKKSVLENKRQLDFFEFQLKEIDEVELVEGEYEELKNEREVLVHAEDLTKNLNRVYYELYESYEEKSILDHLATLSKLLMDSARYDSEINNISEQFDGLVAQLEDVARSIRDRSEHISSDPEKLSEVEERLNIIIKMKNKYGLSIEKILEYAEELRSKITTLETSEDKLTSLEKEIFLLEKNYQEKADLLTESRKKIAQEIEPKIEKELSALGMTKTKFKVEVLTKDNYFSEHGKNTVEFLISPNPGEPLRSLSKTASGGESSRITLALKMVLFDQTKIPTLIFDEIDAGISGKSALIVSQKLAKLAQFSQILCITHLPIVACMADSHFWIEKITYTDKTNVSVKSLEKIIRLEKLAQISGGQVNETSLKYAEEIFTNALNYKKELLMILRKK